MSVFLPYLAPSRDIAYALCWRAWLNAQSNDFNSAFQDIETCYRLGRHNKGEKILVEQLVGMAIEARALQTSRQILDTCKIESIALADFQQRLQTLIDGDNFKPDFRLEKFCMYDEIQRSFTESRFGPSHVYPRRLTEITKINNPNLPPANWLSMLPSSPEDWHILFQVFFTIPNKAESIASANAFYEFWDENFTKTPAQLRAEKIDMEAEEIRIIKNNLFYRTLGQHWCE